MSFGGPPVKTETVEEADELLKADENDSVIGIYMCLASLDPQFFMNIWLG